MSADATLSKKNNKQNTEYHRPTSIEILQQQHALKTDSKNNPMVIQQPMLFS